MAFEKGKSGNPGGRPAKSQQQIDFEEKCKNWAQLFAFDKLKRGADSDNIKESLLATQEILNRGFGKSVETSIVDAYVAPQVGSTAGEIEAGLSALLGSPENGSGAVASETKVDS